MAVRRVRLTLIVLIVLSLLVPIGLVIFRVSDGFAVLGGLGIAFILSRALRMVRIDEQQAVDEAMWNRKANSAHTIYVNLTDEHGVALPKTEQDRLMAEAYAKAGPRDTVIGMRKREQLRASR